MNRLRILVLVAVGLVCFGMAGGYLLYVRGSAAPAGATEPQADRTTILAGSHIVFRNAALGTSYGRLAVVGLDQPAGPRALLDLSCERVYATGSAGVCVTAKRGLVPQYGVTMLDAGLQAVGSGTLVGLPSRARMSRDGTLVATTTFVTGHSYAETSFSTQTIVRRSGKTLGNLESFTTTLPDGQRLSAVDKNFWGVTFATDDDTFYATAASGRSTWLVRGSLRARTMSAVHTDAECPSLSPDGTKVAYKKRLGATQPGVWRLAVLDLASGQETVLAETRSVDDQVEWLGADRVLYALARPGTEATTSDIWQVPADGSGVPSVLIEHASSPAVVNEPAR